MNEPEQFEKVKPLNQNRSLVLLSDPVVQLCY